ncbi:prolyl 4-hydroxylase [Reticulomyxa filosa]|uniref:Prolyl 4-hydroxylase n=1 Tax=Reticulomyxa filosa TaxID=46433 RepID=X6NYY5_RETFI|nr:prolyl 4-hydroxylase [Reticulomyxa filosa]|eukprot:ETO31098.1 prolyl 4-hydroxylase [Reticulomyxa filosa]
MNSLFHRLANIGTDWLKALKTDGYVILDNVVEPHFAQSMLCELKPLRCHSHVHNNNDNTYLIEKSNVWECELHMYKELQDICPDLTRFLNDKSLCNIFNDSKFFPYSFTHHTLKLLYSENGGCFPLHFDSDYRIDHRRITAILYLNEHLNDNNNDNDDDESESGGELKLYPITRPCIKIPAKFNRMVLFSSTLMLHSTSPTHYPRYALNLWLHCDKSKSNISIDTNQYQTHWWNNPEKVKCMAKYMYHKEWRDSILRAHQPTDNKVQTLLKSHDRDLQVSLHKLKPWINEVFAHAHHIQNGGVDNTPIIPWFSL